jgi:glycosyltransferase involved in cell wall biosynthesis
MLSRVTFLLAKDPAREQGGDLATSRVVMRLAADVFDVSAICLAAEGGTHRYDLGPGIDLVKVPKPPVAPPRLMLKSARSRRSLVHERFDVDALLPVIEASDADVFVAEHSYMAETFLRSTRRRNARLIINTINTESQVWKATRGWLGRLECPRILRDEVRVARAAEAVGTYDAEEADFYRDQGVPAARWIDLTFPSQPQIDIASTAPRLVFFGVRDWPPNQEAFLKSLELWPRISAGIPGAELVIAGAKKPGARDPQYPAGVHDVGFVPDLAEFLSTCRALMAPIKTGGGVRAKLLDAASRGLPIVATTPAIGSHGRLLGLAAYDDDDSFVDQCRRFLLDPSAAAAAGRELYEVNHQHWARGRPRQSIEDLLGAAAHVT